MKTLELTGESLAELMGPELASLEVLITGLSAFPKSYRSAQESLAKLRAYQAVIREGTLREVETPDDDGVDLSTI